MKWLRYGDKGIDVEKWQNFLLGYFNVHIKTLVADGDFGQVTFEYTKKFQEKNGLPIDGVVGNQTLGLATRYGFPLIDDSENQEFGPDWPVCPNDVQPISMSDRENLFGKFSYVSAGNNQNPEAIRITDGWGDKNIIPVKIPQLTRVANSPRNCIVYVHIKIANQFSMLWKAWESEKLLDRVMTWNGSYVPRFIRGSRTSLSNHSWGTAFDINVQWNKLGTQPALKGQIGSVRELIPLAIDHGFTWGGWYKNRKDGMHLEAYKIL